ncbi:MULTISPECIES: isochorismatase family cysteine hydrolase [Ramlibacter]|uniref:Isochorismatase family protein n=1 Tax=Ramlibacter pinisoli TaxID=2682844 RepID=A0A6N8INI0_9BURK|nr:MULTISPECIES: isochorismatase family cysteine hydrolase [Ramlibacter]MBA2963275.1 cysteine hydrolase [Ramlibacter sp. CGMCC 1.13660]MVQ28242.1 isochorismatase family protein [Ramlibacter pinisoli]
MDFPQWVVDRVLARQGCLHPYERFDAARTAFVVVDMQNYYTQPGYLGECAASRATFPAVNRLADALRASGGHVVWVQTSADGADEFWSHHHAYMLTPERSARRLRELASSHAGYQLAPGLHVAPADARVTKRCYSALAPNSSPLDAVLRERGVTHVLVGGTVTNVCCESTARDAMMMDYATVMVHDALSAVTPHEHETSLQNWMLFFGDVLGTQDIIRRLQAAPVAATA